MCICTSCVWYSVFMFADGFLRQGFTQYQSTSFGSSLRPSLRPRHGQEAQLPRSACNAIKAQKTIGKSHMASNRPAALQRVVQLLPGRLARRFRGLRAQQMRAADCAPGRRRPRSARVLARVSTLTGFPCPNTLILERLTSGSTYWFALPASSEGPHR